MSSKHNGSDFVVRLFDTIIFGWPALPLTSKVYGVATRKIGPLWLVYIQYLPAKANG